MTLGCFWVTALPTIIKIFKMAMNIDTFHEFSPFYCQESLAPKEQPYWKIWLSISWCLVSWFQFKVTPMKQQRGRSSSQDTHSEECNWCCEGQQWQNWRNHKHLSSVCSWNQCTTYSICKNCKSMHKHNKMQCWHLVCKVLCYCFWHSLPTLEGRCELIFTLTTSGIAPHLKLLLIIFQKVPVAD